MKKNNGIMYNMENENENEVMTYSLEEVKPKKQRKSRAKPKMETSVEERPISLEQPISLEEPNTLEQPISLEQLEEDFSFDDSEFLSELNNHEPLEEAVESLVEEPKPSLEPTRVLPKKRAPRAKPKKVMEETEQIEEIYSNEPTPIYGKDRLVVMQKIQSYKLLFPVELKAFKICKDPTIQDLNSALMEIETIIELGNVDSFVTDSIIQCIKLGEGVSAYTKNFNITGLACLLKQNKQFHSLLKMLYLKYNTFSAIPPEAQLGMIVATTALICVQKNKSKSQIEEYLNEPLTV